MNGRSSFPSVLLIEDDRGMANYLRKQFHERTRLGVMTANTLVEARDLIDQPDLRIDAVVSDLHFGFGTDDPDHELLNGIDMLAYISKGARSNVPKYVLSLWIERERDRAMAAQKKVEVKEWFHKMFYDPKAQEATPWKRIEKDVLEEVVPAGPEVQRLIATEPRLVGAEVAKIAEFVRAVYGPYHFIKTSYVQRAGNEQFLIKKPIEAVCVREEDDDWYRCWALRIGLLVGGEGESIDEALDDLGKVILEQYQRFRTCEEGELVGHALAVKERLDAYLERRTEP